MTATLREPPVALGTGHGGNPARRAVLRWAWRLFRREWRQQSLVLALLLVAVAATTFGLGIAVNAAGSEASEFGTANHMISLSSTGTELDADIATLKATFGTVEVIQHQKIAVAGSATAIDLRAQDPGGPYGASTLRLDSGRYPRGADEIAVTGDVAKIFGLSVGGTWNEGGKLRTVVGLVENPRNLRDRFALVAPGEATPPQQVTALLRASQQQFAGQHIPGGVSVLQDPSGGAQAAVLILATIGMLFAGLLAVAGFTVMAQRRLRALGMLGAIGASPRLVRLVLVANGGIVGAAGALIGAVIGVACWFAVGPWLEPRLGFRIDRFHLPWTTILATVLLATFTALCAAWWPARAAARVPVVSALSARPATPRPAHRWTAAGVILLAGGLAALVLAKQTRPPYIVGGVLATALGLLLFAPAGIAVLGRIARIAPLASRLALRDLARYRARSSAALAAIGLAVGIAAAVSLGAGVSVAKAAAPTGGNLPADQMIVWLAAAGLDGPVPTLTADQLNTAQQQATAIAAKVQAGPPLALQAANDPETPLMDGNGRTALQMGLAHITNENGHTSTHFSGDEAVAMFVATPEMLAHYGIDPASIKPGTDVLTSRTDLTRYSPFPTKHRDWVFGIQQTTALPAYLSLPTALLTPAALTARHLNPIPAGWLFKAPHAITQKQIDQLQSAAAAAGLSVETRPTGADVAKLADDATGVGIAVGLGVLAMTVGLIRSETAGDLRVLAAAGARRGTRRALTAATAGTLALLGALIGTAGAYLALLAWYHKEPHWLAHVPIPDLAALLLGLPALAYIGAWLLAGKEPPAIARRPLD